jgi:hypothetical protein
MTDPEKQIAALFVDRSIQQWIVQVAAGNFWTLPSVEDPWDHRLSVNPTADTDLEPVPGLYKDIFELPF